LHDCGADINTSMNVFQNVINADLYVCILRVCCVRACVRSMRCFVPFLAR